MKASQALSFSGGRPAPRGFVLILVLVFLVLVSTLIVAFFLSVSSELSTSKSYANGANARQLADSAVEAVIGQVRLATASTDATGKNTLTWASQPGMIRSYQAGQPLYSYKLYSSDSMIVSGAPAFANDFDSSWSSSSSSMNTGRYTDLNSPVSGQFPIIDPRAAGIAGGTYSLVDGFGYSGTVAAGTGSLSIPGVIAPASTTDTNARLPMPVKWIYLLKDGTMTVPDGGTGNTATWSGTTAAIAPSASNPIVGRIAFWTDDETCKLNLNTACGGTYWDTPSAMTGMEEAYSRYKPLANEFNRFPGHPATTSLLPVFWSFAGLTSPNTNLVPAPNPGTSMTVNIDVAPTLTTLASNAFTSLLNLSPRNAMGGSTLGTVATTGYNTTQTAVQPDADRLYATIDEALFAAPKSTAAPNSARISNAVGTYNLAASDVEKLRFFLTANSRAPELNPFNLPKISMWPVPQTTPTPTDNLFAFCSTLNGNAYYFTRNNSLSATADWTTRNDSLFNYLINLWAQPVPGFGGTIQTRYTQDGDNRILTLIYDYIRSTVNIFDTYGATGTGAYYTMSYPYSFMKETNYNNLGFGQVTPINITKSGTTYKGLGRFPGIKQVALMFIAQAANQPPCLISSTGIPTGTINPMHPWTSNSSTVTSVSNADGTYTITAPNAYPVISGQTHAGLPFLSNMWINPSTFAAVLANPTTTANKAILAEILNPRYQGPATLYGAGSGSGATNSQALPLPSVDPNSGTLRPHMTQIQAIVLIDPVDPAAGVTALGPAMIVEITGLNNMQADGQSLGFGSDLIQTTSLGPKITGSYNLGMTQVSTYKKQVSGSGSTRLNFISQPVIVGGNSLSTGGNTFNFTGSNIVVKIWAPNAQVGTSIATSTANATLVQTLNIDFPSSTTFPTPLLAPLPPETSKLPLLATTNPQYTTGITENAPVTVSDLSPSTLLTFDYMSGLGSNPNFGVGSVLYDLNHAHTYYGGTDLGSQFYILPERTTDPTVDYHAKLASDTVRSMEVLYGDTRLASTFPNVPAGFYVPHKFYTNTTMRAAHTLRGGGYVVSSSDYLGATANYLTAAYASIAPASLSLTSNKINYDYFCHGLDGRGVPSTSPTSDILNLASLSVDAGIQSDIESSFPYVTSSTEFNDTVFTGVSSWSGLTKFSTVWANGGDFDTGIGQEPDGPTINKTNEADMSTYPNADSTNPDFNPYAGDVVQGYRLPAAFSPNRFVPSPVALGSLPVPVDSTNPNTPDPTHAWRTLLFSPNPASYNLSLGNNAAQTRSAVQQVTEAGAVPSGATAPDHLFLDFFEMPVVAPYAISEPFSTAGKVNMNYQIAPFTYITRTTALRGVLRDSAVTAIPDQWIGNYKSTGSVYASSTATAGDNQAYYNYLTGGGNWGFRFPIDATDTLKQFDQRFSNNDLFRSPSEICSLWLYPATQPTTANPELPNTPLVTWDSANANIKAWWYSGSGTTAKSITGDNLRERPYETIYPRLTTQSNTYTVHFQVQVLQKIPTTPVAQWVDGTDKVQSEYRGSTIIERYIDPSDTTIPDAASSTVVAGPLPSLDANYRYRVVATKRFAP